MPAPTSQRKQLRLFADHVIDARQQELEAERARRLFSEQALDARQRELEAETHRRRFVEAALDARQQELERAQREAEKLAERVRRVEDENDRLRRSLGGGEAVLRG